MYKNLVPDGPDLDVQNFKILNATVNASSVVATPIDFNFRNTDKKRRERVALNRAMGKRPEPRKQIKVVSTPRNGLFTATSMFVTDVGYEMCW